MTIYSAFSIPTLAMRSQSHALNVIGNNVANVTTGGFKRTDVTFSTMLSDDYFEQSDIGGVKPNDFNRIDAQGVIISSDSNFDVSINGQGFFILDTLQTGGQRVYTRDGGFSMATGADVSVTADDGSTITVKEGHLVDKNGYYVQGYAWDNVAGAFNTTLAPMRIDPYAFTSVGAATTTANLSLNLPSNGTIVTNHANAVTDAIFNNTVTEGLELYTIDVIDSAFVHQEVSLYFSRDSVNNWSMSSATSQTPVAQVDTLTLAGTIEAGDTYTANIGGSPYSYITTGAEADISAVRDALMAVINADANLTVTATTSGVDSITLTADSAGTAFTTAPTAAHGSANVAQVDSITISGFFELGDSYNATVNGAPYSYISGGGDASNNDAATGLAALINADPGVTAVAAGSVITITAATAGTPFALTAVTALGGADNTQLAVPAVVTANYTAINDSTMTVANTTANVLTKSVSTPTALVFDAGGVLTSPATALSLPLTFAGASTATVALDLSGMTQFAGGFMPFSYSSNGFASSVLRDFEYDKNGQLIGNFQDGTDRAIYRMPLAQFSNPNAMGRQNGNTFVETSESGTPRVVLAGSSGYASFAPGTHEISNVDLAGEFSKMIMTQNAYNAAANVFKAVDEMTMAARDLKR